MQITYNSLIGLPLTVELTRHDISNYGVLYHVTPKENRKNIEEKGLLLDQPRYKSMVGVSMIFVSYPQSHTTADLFRFYPQSHCIVALDVDKLVADGFEFYDDWLSSQDQSSNRNHLCCPKSIPREYIQRIIEIKDDE